MNCREFREIADTYLSDELLVETNHEVFRHLENCVDCRTELSQRRDTRARLRSAIKNDVETTINPIFATKLQITLHEHATVSAGWFNWSVFTPVFAAMIIAASIGFIWFYSQTNGVNSAQANLHKAALQALNRHEYCGLEHVQKWQANAENVSPENASYVATLLENKSKVLEIHDCELDGKVYRHYVLQSGEKIISVLKTEGEFVASSDDDDVNVITSESQHGFQIASFHDKSATFFVVSDLSEAENLNLARKLSDSI